MTATHIDHVAELYTLAGPTGDFVRVLAGEVRDYGGNVLFAGSADQCIHERCSWQIATRLVPTQWERVGEIAGADVTWQPVVE